MFLDMIDTIRVDTVNALFRVQIHTEADTSPEERLMEKMGQQHTIEHRGDSNQKVETVKRTGKKVGRNEPCPCGSGKKYKKCHGAKK